jgi:glutathione S-transferase
MSTSVQPTLVIGDKNLSSWSLRPWLLLRHNGVAFEELRLPLDTPEFYARIGSYSPTARVPVLHHGDLVVWDSLAICEYVNENFLAGAAWPTAREARAVARSVSAEMHSGFQTLRSQMPMNCRLRRTDFVPSTEARGDIDRVCAIWRDCRSRFGAGGPFLFGAFSIADAMYAPVALRLRSYGVRVGPIETDYIQALLALPALQQWLAAADVETAPV